MAAENNDSHSIFVKYASRKSKKVLFVLTSTKTVQSADAHFWYWAVIIHTSSWSWCALINILCCLSNLSFNATLLSVTCRRKSLKLPEHLLTATALEQEKYKVVNYWHHNFSMYGVLLAPTAWSGSSAQHSTADCQRFTSELLLWGSGMTHDKEKYCRSQNKIAVLGFS